MKTAAQKDELLAVRLSSTLKGDLEDAAERAGLGLSDWVRAVLARAANEGAFAPSKRRKHGKKRKG